MNTEKKYKNRIRELRTAQNIHPDDLADLLGVTTKHIYDLELWKRRLHEDAIVLLAERFHCSTDYLLGFTDEPSKAESIKRFDEDVLSKLPESARAALVEYQEFLLRKYKVIE